jgi:uracil-DNA glycosylase
MLPPIPREWRSVLSDQERAPYYLALDAFLEAETERYTVYPPRDEIFNALRLTSFDDVKVVILGQDPYPGPGQAHGLAFSVRPGVPIPASLRNIYKELATDVGFRVPNHGNLELWAARGVLLLNAVLTVRAGMPNSHSGVGWEMFTDEVIRSVNCKKTLVAFVLWGAYAQRKLPLIDVQRHAVVMGAHPSPLSARNGFFGSRPFSRINAALEMAGEGPVDWGLPDL